MRFIEALIELDKNLFLWINQLSGNPILDSIMLTFSAKWVWLPLYGFLAYRLFRTHSSSNMLWLFLAVGIMIVITDQGSVQFFKEVFHRSRPCHQSQLKDLINLVKGNCGGQFGFISSHAANVFGLAVFFRIVLPRFGWGMLLFTWAAIVSFSRVYLGVHYPGDVIAGALFGIIIGLLLATITMRSIVK